MVLTYTGVAAEYDALHRRAIVVDRSHRDRMTFGGPGAADALNGLVTNDVGALSPGQGMYAAALTAKGKVVADIRVLLKASVNDPQGLSIRGALRTLGFAGVEDVRAGKLMQIRVSASDRASAEQSVEAMCAQLLANPVIETYSFTLVEAPAPVP